MSEDLENLQALKKTIEMITNMAMHPNDCKDCFKLEESLKIKMATYIYQSMIDEVDQKMIEIYGKEFCEKIFNAPEVVDGESEISVEEFVKSLFEAFPRKIVLSEILKQGNYGFPFNGTWLMIPKDIADRFEN